MCSKIQKIILLTQNIFIIIANGNDFEAKYWKLKKNKRNTVSVSNGELYSNVQRSQKAWRLNQNMWNITA